jgi:hypothetical protein
MTELTLEQRRLNRKVVLDALKRETGSSGGDAAAARVDAYRADPVNAPSDEYIYVGALRLTRFYVDPSKPNGAERQGLWTSIRSPMGKSVTPVPRDIDGTMTVRTLQLLAEERP